MYRYKQRKTASFRNENWRFWSEWRDSFAFSSLREENRGVAAVQPAARDSPPDCPIEMGSNPVLSKSKKTRHPVGVSCLFGPGVAQLGRARALGA